MLKIKSYLSLIKFSHTIFALPFAAIGFFIGSRVIGDQFLDWKLFGLVVFCMVTARNAAMAFNRWADRDFDKLNPRTESRELPSGVISSKHAILFVVVNSLLFILAAFLINFICFLLSPIALFIILGYSYTKRFSWLCHVFLGLGLSLAPIGAYLAVTGHFHFLPILYSVAVICWVAGFDIIYALQDVQFDQKYNLQSIPAHFGYSKSLVVSSVLHIICGLSIMTGAWILYRDFDLSYLMFSGSLGFIILLISQHVIIGKGDLSKINLAFFTTNGIASIVLAVGTILDFYW
ncbi:MAG: UbiA family prenyltransferase [Saprospiraceae bacterium]|nr:UbiA family prenyltransferase [Saprospiraceae bacterium]MBK8449219.1 UbiA family prenyltransferase [Saprospiraceae bacterium]MBK8484705.1 UbiA family prenyltransferase [Saprospiraceae bacterium]MBK9222132.1 UbiA family prenyltransferase [Saprospiraceae bacterium]MBK9720958.1 UbiA family prenyltransferase [Saprospiraceae bacterium]